MNSAALGQRLRSSGAWAASGRILSGLLLVALHGILAQGLSSRDYGQYVLIESVALVLSVVCMAGIPTVALRLMRSSLSEGDDHRASLIAGSTAWVFFATSLVTALVTIVVSQVSRKSLPDGLTWEWMPWFLAWAILSAGLRIQSEIYRAYDRYSLAYCIGGQSGGLLLNGSLVAFSIWAVSSERISVQGVLAMQIAVQLVLILTATGELRRHWQSLWSPGNRQMTGLLFLSAWPLLAQQLVSVGLPEAGKLLLGLYGATEDTTRQQQSWGCVKILIR
jgi:O-antigen/teichoic acid export membrane protein